jgi:hypothetical protein
MKLMTRFFLLPKKKVSLMEKNINIQSQKIKNKNLDGMLSLLQKMTASKSQVREFLMMLLHMSITHVQLEKHVNL